MYEIKFGACDKDSSAVHTKTVEISDSEELNTEWKEFCKEVPFTKWYSDNEVLTKNAPESLHYAVESF